MNRKGLEKPPRVKPTVLDRRTAAPTTPVPRWKVLGSPLLEEIAMAGKSAGRGTIPPSPSARKLAALLWDFHELPLPTCLPGCLYSPNWIPHNSSPPGAAPFDNSSPFSQPDYVLSPSSCKSANHRHMKTRANRGEQTNLQRLLTKTSVESAHASVVVDRQRHIPCSQLFATTEEDEVESGHDVKTSQELFKVFSQIRMLEEQHNSSLNETTALHAELMQAHARVRQLELPDRMARREVEGLMKRFSDEKMSWKVKEKEKIKAAVQSVKEELEEERKEKNRLESANRRLTKELKEAQMATSKALQELENARKTRQLIEEVCTELSQETENDKAEVEAMKRQAQLVREALEEERRMLQLAEVWREERVQMKLGEARLTLETKSAALDVMRAELESFLKKKQNGDTYDNSTFRDAQVLHNVISAVLYDSFPTTSEYMYVATVDTDSSQESRNHEHALLYYPEGIPDAD